MDGWIDRWMDGWMDGSTGNVLRGRERPTLPTYFLGRLMGLGGEGRGAGSYLDQVRRHKVVLSCVEAVFAKYLDCLAAGEMTERAGHWVPCVSVWCARMGVEMRCG